MPDLAGPRGPVPYTRDEWGYPTVNARDSEEGVWARGWFAGHDRPLQVTFTIRAAEGRLMETMGDQPFTRLVDRATRSLGLTHDLDQQLEALSADTRRWLGVYCDGFNAGVEAGGWPWALRLAGVDKLVYEPRHVLLYYRIMTWFGLTSLHHTAKLVCGQLMADGAPLEAMQMLLGRGAEGLDPAIANEMAWPLPDGVPGLSLQQGSNAFAVSAKRSATGSALLMTEFHLEIGRLPPVCWAFSIQLPDGQEQTGICIPGLPFISAGRTRDVAWGWTFGHADNFQLTAERCEDGGRLVGGARQKLQLREEVVKIRGADDETWRFWDFDGGTVLGDANRGGLLPAVRWRGLRQTAGDIEAFRVALTSRTAEEAATAQREVKGVGLAGVFADADGHIAWVHTGRVPANRVCWGLHGPDHCDGPDAPESERPYKLDPEEGFIASANEACEGWTAFPEPRYRHERLCELLGVDRLLHPDDLLQMSYDELDGCARRLIPVWAPFLPDDQEAAAMAAWAGGGRVQDALGRAAMGLFHALHRELLRALVAAHTGPHAARAFWDELDLLLPFQDRLDDVLALEDPEHCTGRQLAGMIQAAWPEAKRRAAAGEVSGPVRASFKNMVTRGWLRFLGFSTAKMDFPGGPTSVFQSRRSAMLGETLYGGPAFHLLIDMGKPGVRYNMAGGASEKRTGPGYAAGIEAWRTGVLKPLGQPS